jgi:thiol-disulfide isomerase/thioredoxin
MRQLAKEIMKMIAVLQTDCPTCQLIVPYLNRLAASGVPLTGISQDAPDDTADFVRRMEVAFPLDLDPGYRKSVSLGVSIVPTLVVLDDAERAVLSEPGFAKTVLNEIAAMFGLPEVAGAYDGAPSTKPGCSSRHLEVAVEDAIAMGWRASFASPSRPLRSQRRRT